MDWFRLTSWQALCLLSPNLPSAYAVPARFALGFTSFLRLSPSTPVHPASDRQLSDSNDGFHPQAALSGGCRLELFRLTCPSTFKTCSGSRRISGTALPSLSQLPLPSGLRLSVLRYIFFGSGYHYPSPAPHAALRGIVLPSMCYCCTRFNN